MQTSGRSATDLPIVQQPVAQLEKADPAQLKVNIGQRNGKISSFLDQYRMDKIRELTEEQEGIIRRVVTDGMAAGHPPAKMASLIHEHIGLTPYQAQQVQNYRADLETLNTTALQRQLRDKRFDMPVARAIADGKPLTPEQIDRFTGQYHDNWLRMRASMIARTEALHAANMGGRLAIEQAVEDGNTSGFDVERTWLATNDARTRNSHRELNGCGCLMKDQPTSAFPKTTVSDRCGR